MDAANGEGDDIGEEQREADHTETSPLIHTRRNDTNTRDIQGRGKAFWIMQYLLLVPYPVILVTQLAMLVLGALPQTLADGNPALLGKPLHGAWSTY